MRLIRTLLVLLVPVSVPASVASAEETYRWTQYVEGGGLEARAATRAAACPDATRDGTRRMMTVRAEPDKDFPILVCTLTIPDGTRKVAVDGVRVPLRQVEPPSRILLIGDTGCRISKDKKQACNDRAQWPFRSIAAIAAKMKRDLIIHVGDYYYREIPCPDDKLGCTGPSGDTWETWRADFFEPVGPLLAAAPWVFVRGNHEKCGRGGKGWSRLLDAFPFDAVSACKNNYVSSLSNVNCEKDVSPRFVVDIGDVKLVVVDVAAADEKYAVPNDLVECYRPHFEGAASGTGPIWLALHEPIWSPKGEKEGREDRPDDGNATLASAARVALGSKANVQAMLSGHIHAFEVMSYADDLPIQIVSGNGGDELECHQRESECDRLSDFHDLKINDVKVKIGRGIPSTFGFSMLERHQGYWSVVAYDTYHDQANKRLTCRMQGRALDCH